MKSIAAVSVAVYFCVNNHIWIVSEAYCSSGGMKRSSDSTAKISTCVKHHVVRNNA